VLPRTTAAVTAGIGAGLHLGVQVYVSVRGEPVADVGLGQARPGVPLTADTLMVWMSSCKPVGAVAVARLWERGALALDDPVSRVIPEFGRNGKDAVTVRHLLTHTGGFRFVESPRRDATWDEVIAHIGAAPLEPRWVPGRRAGYHPSSSWYVLAEIVRRLDGRPYAQFVRDEIFEPLGLHDSWIGMPPGRARAYGDRLGALYDTTDGEPRPSPLDAEALGWLYRPGGSGRGPARELGRWYEMLLTAGARGGVRILTPQTVEALTAHHRVGMVDETFRHVIDWGLGFILDSNRYGADTVPYGYGPYCSARTFGHSGAESSTAFCDPERGLVVAWAANGTPGDARHQVRARALNAAIYEDLGFAAPPGP